MELEQPLEFLGIQHLLQLGLPLGTEIVGVDAINATFSQPQLLQD